MHICHWIFWFLLLVYSLFMFMGTVATCDQLSQIAHRQPLENNKLNTFLECAGPGKPTHVPTVVYTNGCVHDI